MGKLGLIGCILCFLCFPTYGQKDTVKLGQVEVTSKKRSAARKISEEVLSSNPTKSIGQTLEQYSAVYIKNYGPGSMSTISLRGASASQTEVNWNGIKLNNALSGQMDLSLVPVFLVDRAAISSQGNLSGSFGGSINLGSEFSQKPVRVDLMQQVGSFGQLGSGVSLSLNQRETQLSIKGYRFAAQNNFTFTNTALPGKPEQSLRQADYLQSGLQLHVRQWIKNHAVSFIVWKQQFQRNLPLVMSYQGAGRRETQTDADLRSILTWKWYRKKTVIHADLIYSALNNSYQVDNKISEAFTEFVSSKSSVNTVQPAVTLNFKPKPTRTILIKQCVALENAAYSDFVLHTKRPVQRQVYSGVFSWLESFNKNWEFQGVLNQQILEAFEIPLAYKGVLRKSFQGEKSRTRVVFWHEKNVRIPTLNDINFYPGGNPNVKPEQSVGLANEINWELMPSPKRSIEITLNLYRRKVLNYIQWRPSEFAYWKPLNLPEVRVHGFDATANLNFGKIGKTKQGYRFQSNLNIAFNRSYELENTGQQQLIYTPKWVGNAWNYVRIFDSKIGLGTQFVGKRETQTAGNSLAFHELKPYFLMHATWSKTWKLNEKNRLDFSLRMNNLLNQNYQNVLWRAMPRRNFEIVCKWILN